MYCKEGLLTALACGAPRPKVGAGECRWQRTPPHNDKQPSMNIVNVGYDSTNYYLLEAKGGKLLIDCGWPGTLPKLMAELKRKGISASEIKYLLITHFHPDHAGITQELKKLG